MEKLIIDVQSMLRGKVCVFDSQVKSLVEKHCSKEQVVIYMPSTTTVNFCDRGTLINLASQMFTCQSSIIPIDNQTKIFESIMPFIEPNGYLFLEGDGANICSNIEAECYYFQFVKENFNGSVAIRKTCPQLIQFGIVMATYKRPNNSTKSKIERALACVKSQTYQNFKLFLIGDKYTDQEEFESYASLLEPEKIIIENLPIAWERDQCQVKANLWTIGGANAMNTGLKKLEEHNIIHYCHLDDDDVWHPNHLYDLAVAYDKYKVDFVTTIGRLDQQYLPLVTGCHINNYIPRSGTCFHSSQSWNIKTIPFRYHTVIDFANESEFMPADAHMLNQISQLVTQGTVKTFSVPYLTCFRKSEGEARSY